MEKIGEDFLRLSISKHSDFYGAVWITQNPVGVDAHIDPANKTDFTQLQCEFDGAQWGDVGIAPYEQPAGAVQMLISALCHREYPQPSALWSAWR